jgi:hypothetical protein
MIKWIKSWFKKKYKSESGFQCPHKHKEGKIINITVFGKKVKIGSPFCESCTVEYMNKYSTICAECGQAIMVGEPVGVACENAEYPYPYVHLTFECTFSGGQFCGHWGEGKLKEFVIPFNDH